MKEQIASLGHERQAGFAAGFRRKRVEMARELRARRAGNGGDLH